MSKPLLNRLLVPLLFSALPFACAGGGEEDPFASSDKEDARHLCGQDLGVYVQEGTAGRIESLNAYAKRKLASEQCAIDDILERRGQLTEDTPKIADVYTVRVGSEAECLSGGLFFADYDLETMERYVGMKKQVDMAIDFLARFHEDSAGIPTVLFDRITLCPKEFFGEHMELAGQTLYVNPSFTQFGGIDTVNGRDLRTNFWAPGVQFIGTDLGEKFQPLWPLFDPAGTLRTVLRKGAAERVAKLIKKLTGSFVGGLIGDAVEEQRDTLASLVGEHVADSTEEKGGESFRDRALRAIANASAEDIQCMGERWLEVSNDPEALNSAAEAGISAMYKQIHKNALDLKVKQNAAIAVGNTHLIDVNLDLFFSNGYKELERFIEIKVVEQNVQWEQNALVAVYTVDDININVGATVDKALQSASFVESARRCAVAF